MGVDLVLGPSEVGPLAGRDLLYDGRRPRRLVTLGVVPDVDEAILLQGVVGLYPGHVRDCGGRGQRIRVMYGAIYVVRS